MTKIIWSAPSVVDLESIHAYIARDSVAYADTLISDIFESVDKLAYFPKSGRVVPEMRREQTRELIVGHYRIIYDVADRMVRVLTVIHSSRLLRR